MELQLLHPSDQVAMILSRVYKGGMTTTSGGNISVREDNGDIWITPKGEDKGTLTPRDVVCIKADGTMVGKHAPSSEHPFHTAIYRCRPDLKAIVHAHPPALVSFSIVRQIPDTHVIPQAQHVCGPVGYAPYALPGSEALGERIAQEFKQGYNSVIMENHGTVVGGVDPFDAYQRFETLEFCARTIIKSHEIGKPNRLSDEQIQRFEEENGLIPEMETAAHPAEERAIRRDICRFIERACDQKLMISTYGTVSARWKDNDFLITPYGIDRRYIQPKDIVQIASDKREAGKIPSRSVHLHQEIYNSHPSVNCIITTQAPNATAFCIAGKPFDTRTIPESYILLQDIPLIPYGGQFRGSRVAVEALSKETPTLLLQNDSILVTGKSILETFDRLEVAEFSARSLINAASIGELVPIADQEIADLRREFLM